MICCLFLWQTKIGSSFFLFSLCSHLSSREQKEVLGVFLYIGNNWSLICDGDLVWRLFFFFLTEIHLIKNSNVVTLTVVFAVPFNFYIISVGCHSLCCSAPWNIQMPYAINMHTSLRTLRFWEYLELFSHNDLISAVSLNGSKKTEKSFF